MALSKEFMEVASRTRHLWKGRMNYMSFQPCPTNCGSKEVCNLHKASDFETVVTQLHEYLIGGLGRSHLIYMRPSIPDFMRAGEFLSGVGFEKIGEFINSNYYGRENGGLSEIWHLVVPKEQDIALRKITEVESAANDFRWRASQKTVERLKSIKKKASVCNS